MPEVSPDVHSTCDPRTTRYVPMALWLFDHEDEIPPTAARVYAALASFYNAEEGGAWPGWEKLGERVRRSRATVARCLTLLEGFGLITRTRRGSGRSNFYEFPDHPWMHEHDPSTGLIDETPVAPVRPVQVAAGETSNEDFSQTRSTPVLRTGRNALRTSASRAARSPIRAVADGDFDELDSPALGEDRDGISETLEQKTRRRQKRPRPADPADWNARELGEYFVAQCSKAVTEGKPLMESFVGSGSAGAVSSHARRWMEHAVAPAQIKLDIDHFVDNYRSYRIPGVKPDKAFLAQIAGIREKTLRQSAYDADDAYVLKTQPAKRWPYASA